MAISRVSRYQRNTTSIIIDRHGNRQVAIMRRVPTAQQMRVMDTLWRHGDRVDLLANRYLGAPQDWWVVAEANPQTLEWTAPAEATPVMVPHATA